MLKNKKVIVIGLGLTGLSCVRWLIRVGAHVAVADSRYHPPAIKEFKTFYPHIPLYKGPLNPQLLQQYALIVRSPGVSKYDPALIDANKKGIPIIGDIELFAQHIANWSSRVIAITGSNGKSTVTTMVQSMTKKAGLSSLTAGNIGVPVLDTLLAIEMETVSRPDIFVLELSSFQLETTYSLNATAATVLNVSEDHLERYQSMADYATTKARIFQGKGIMVLNRQSDFCIAMADSYRKVQWFGQDPPRTAEEYGLQPTEIGYELQQGGHCLIPANDLAIPGLHNASNALAAIALCEAIGLPRPPLISALREFTGLAHRVQYIATIGQVTYYDDSKGTNIGATQAALSSMIRPVVLIAGGQGKGQDFSLLKATCAKHCRAVILLGQDALQIAIMLEKVVPIIQVKNMQEAVISAAKSAKPGDVVLLSPACASLDMFKDYKDRAAAFITAVKSLEHAYNEAPILS